MGGENMKKITLAAMMILLLGAATTHGADTIILTKTGQGASALRPFTVNDEWEIQWDAAGTTFNLILHPVEIHGLTSKSADTPAPTQTLKETMAMSPTIVTMSGGAGTHYVPKGGKYYLDIMAINQWTISIVQ